ncbi:MAG: L,D-transpeptidase [Candidatus Absconditabacterales bacterium]
MSKKSDAINIAQTIMDKEINNKEITNTNGTKLKATVKEVKGGLTIEFNTEEPKKVTTEKPQQTNIILNNNRVTPTKDEEAEKKEIIANESPKSSEILGENHPVSSEIFSLQSLTKSFSQNIIKEGLTYKTIFDKISKIKNAEVMTTIENYLLKGQIKEAQKYVGMKEGSAYADNAANGVLDRNTLNRLTNRMVGLSGNELLQETSIPQDIKDAYTNFELKIGLFDNLGEPYTIVSKANSYAYLFKGDHTLMSVHKVILGKDKGDQPNRAYEGDDWTTPGGMYYAYANKEPDKQYAGPGDYIVLYPMEGQYLNVGGYTLGIHTRYLVEPQRKIALETDGTDTRMSHGCINTLENKGAGAIYDNLVINTNTGSKVYVTKEP